jgi:hypothetical protein
MNSKKAKRLRQLVRHLQDKAAIAESEWSVPGVIKYTASKFSASSIVGNAPSIPESPFDGITYQRVLSADCGKSIYRTMKKRALGAAKAK